MSGIAGIYYLDERLVDRSDVVRMLDSLAHRGPDGSGVWVEGSVGLGHRMLWTTPEALHEQLPLSDRGGNLVITADARIDNREELISALEIRDRPIEQITDSAIILAAYEKWGAHCPSRILGDFAFLIWDRRERKLLCARDPVGIKPFYYYSDNRMLLFGSELGILLTVPGVRRAPNEGMIAEYLAASIESSEETLFQKIFRLPPAHVLVVHGSCVRKERYWDIDPIHAIRYRSDEEYAEHFLSIFKEAVACRLRTYGRVGAYLSGGLDSSSVVGIMQLLANIGGPFTSHFETFSLMFPDVDAFDDSGYIQDAVNTWRIKSNSIVPHEPKIGLYMEQAQRYQDFPDYPNSTMLEPLMAMARVADVRILFTGYGGDEWFTGSRYQYADLIHDLRLLEWLRQAQLDPQGLIWGIFPSQALITKSLLPLLPETVRRHGRKVLRRDRQPSWPWLTSAFVKRVNLAERVHRVNTGQKFTSLAQQELYRLLVWGSNIHGMELQDRSGASFGIEERHPFYDRRIIEFAFAIPDQQRRRHNQTKLILRNAMRTILPEQIRQRTTKADFSHVFPQALASQGGANLFKSLGIADEGWVDGSHVESKYHDMMYLYVNGDDRYTKHMWALWAIFGIEQWFQAVF